MIDWLHERGIPFSPEVYTGYGNDPPLDEAMVVAMATLMTNIDRPIYGFTDAMPTEVRAALFARYSRSSRPLRLVLAREFWDNDGLKLAQAVNASITDIHAARRLFKRVISEYGDDSVAQLGVAGFACEMVSQLAVKEIEDGRIGGWLEKSTRYVNFGKEVNGKFLYLRPLEVMNSPLAGEYEEVMDEAFRLYRQSVQLLIPYLEKQFPQQPNIDAKVYKGSIRAKAFDVARAFLPMATLTNVGMVLSAQSVESLINKMETSPLMESKLIAHDLHSEADKIIPSLISRLGEAKYGGAARDYLSQSRDQTRTLAVKILEQRPQTPEGRTPEVKLVWRQTDALERVVAAILFPHEKKRDLEQLKELVVNLSLMEKKNIVDAYLTGRTDRRHKPGRAFEEAVYSFSITGNVGVWRDMQRMKMLVQQRQLLTVELGVEVPTEYVDIELEGLTLTEVFRNHLVRRNELFHKLAETISSEVAQYVVAFGNLMHWMMTLNLREMFHLVPLRAGAAGHPAYRKMAREMFYQTVEVDPILTMPMARFVDFSDEPRLERLAQLKRVREKLIALGGKGEDTFND